MQIHRATTLDVHARRRRCALSLPEVLVVIAIVALLLAMLMPSLNGAREKARRVICASNLREWSTAFHAYLDENNQYLPTEGTYVGGGIRKRQTWFNALPPYLGLPAYMDIPGSNDDIEDLPDMHVWVCPSKNLTDAYKSKTGKNQFHYGMNQVLDGLGKEPDGSKDAPGYPDQPNEHMPAIIYHKLPHTVLMFDISPNSPAGTPRNVATKYQRGFLGEYLGKFHGDYANVLHLAGYVDHCVTDDLVTDHDFRHGDVIWDRRRLYWGYPPPGAR